jgi:asparagine synthase (glutamine-hydrolysing)
MFRFVSLAWNQRSPSESAAARRLQKNLLDDGPSWITPLARPGLVVFATGLPQGIEESYIHSGGSGVILGNLFYNRPSASMEDVPDETTLSNTDWAAITSSGGRRLVERFWGSYVAILCDSATDAVYVLRAPMGDLPCFYALIEGVQVCFSRAEDYRRLGVGRFEINWSFFETYLAFRDPHSSETGISEISELLMGECIAWHRGKASKTTYWDPCSIAKSEPIEHVSEAVNAVRSAGRFCVGTWASSQRNILHRLSGGLDSSIVLACLHAASRKPIFACVNRFSVPRDDERRLSCDDERRFARSLTDQYGCELIERERDLNLNLNVFLDVSSTPRPMRDFSAYENHQPERALAQKRGATAVFCGGLGDNLFEQPMYRLAVSDYLWRHGVRPGLLHVAFAVALCGRQSIWRALATGIRQRRAQRSESFWDVYFQGMFAESRRNLETTLVTREVFEKVADNRDRFLHPWFRQVDDVPPAKLWMAGALAGEMLYNGPFTRVDDPMMISPLASQPLVEICLRVASYLSVDAGCDRSIARQAFARDLPVAIFSRASKGTQAPWTRERVKQSRPFAREFLLDGLLVKKGILDKKKLEDALADRPIKTRFKEQDVIRQLYHEAWLRNWVKVGAAA